MARDRGKQPTGSSTSTAAHPPKTGEDKAETAKPSTDHPMASHAIASKLGGAAPASTPAEPAKTTDIKQSAEPASAGKTPAASGTPSTGGMPTAGGRPNVGGMPADRPAASTPPTAASRAGKGQAASGNAQGGSAGGHGGFWPGLLGGVIGGAATALAASFFWTAGNDGITTLQSASDALAGRVTQAEEQIGRIGALDERLAAVEGTGDSGLADRLGEFETRLAALGNGSGGGALTERLAAFEQELQTLAADLRATADAQQSSAETIASVEATVADTGKLVETNGQSVETLTEEAQKLAGTAEQLSGDLQSLATRVGEAEGRLDHLGGAYQRGAAMIVAIGDIDRAISRSEPYASALTSLQSLAKDDDALGASLAALEPAAADGVPGLAALKSSFGEAASRALLADEGDRSLTDQVGDNLFGIINMRPAGAEAEGSDSRAILARARARLAQDDLGSALAELATLEGGAAEAMQPWIARAESRIAAEAAVQQLRTHAQSLVATGS
ncbi:MAG: mitofilin family membrane protein [Alphaproteobacteria bacterium]